MHEHVSMVINSVPTATLKGMILTFNSEGFIQLQIGLIEINFGHRFSLLAMQVSMTYSRG